MTASHDTADAPAVSRTATAPYAFPPSHPLAPPVHECTVADLLDLAAGAAYQQDQLWALVGHQDYVRAICRLLVEHVAPERDDLEQKLAGSDRAVVDLRNELAQSHAELAAARRLVAETQAKLAREVLAHAETMAQCCAQLRESLALAGK